MLKEVEIAIFWCCNETKLAEIHIDEDFVFKVAFKFYF